MSTSLADILMTRISTWLMQEKPGENSNYSDFEKTCHELKPADVVLVEGNSIAEAFASVRFPILPIVRQVNKHRVEFIPRNTRLYTPADFDYSPYFTIIKCPKFPMAEVAPYRQMPWNETGAVCIDDENIYVPPGFVTGFEALSDADDARKTSAHPD